MYESAKLIAKQILTDNMSDYEKVLAIHDYIVLNATYDHNIVEAGLTTEESTAYDAFYLEGVFNDGFAVCSGLSRAFTLLCGIEGIKTIVATGTASGGGHAWSKVLLDIDKTDNDYIKKWYIVDITWDDATKDSNYEILRYNNFLISDAEATSNGHTEDATYQSTRSSVALTYDKYENAVSSDLYYYKNEVLSYDDGTLHSGDLYIESNEELNNVFGYLNTLTLTEDHYCLQLYIESSYYGLGVMFNINASTYFGNTNIDDNYTLEKSYENGYLSYYFEKK
ncbi:MAG: transglutaminase domain-containing protein [Clostridia bacterium]